MKASRQEQVEAKTKREEVIDTREEGKVCGRETSLYWAPRLGSRTESSLKNTI